MIYATASIEHNIEELKVLKTDIAYIKTHMVDVDSIMTKEDYIALEEYKNEKSEKLLVSYEQLKKESCL